MKPATVKVSIVRSGEGVPGMTGGASADAVSSPLRPATSVKKTTAVNWLTTTSLLSSCSNVKVRPGSTVWRMVK